MSAGEVPLKARLAALSSQLSAHPGAVVAALADDGCRVPLPGSVSLGEHRALAVSDDRETMLNIVVPADRISVVAAWEQTCSDGFGVTSVHVLSDPDSRMTLSMFDVREVYGVRLAVLTRAEESAEGSALLARPLVVPSRPRRATMHKSMTAVIVDVDTSVTSMLGWSADRMVGMRSSEFIHPDDRDRAVSSWMALLSGKDSQRVRVRHRCADGSWLWLEVEHLHNGADDPNDVDVVAHISDISEEMAAHEALRRREQLFSRLAEALPTGVLELTSDGTAIYANARLGEILQTDSPTTVIELLAAISPADRPAVSAALEAALQRGIDSGVEIGLAHKRGTRRCALSVAAVPDQEGQPAALICVNDITESATLREELRLQATHDVLTGLPNHRALVAAIDHELERARRNGRRFALAFVDLDHFKALNDTLGHGVGDSALRETGEVIKASLRAVDIVGRWGGEEFVVLLPETESVGALRAAERIRAAVAKHRYESAQGSHLTCSIGVATHPEDGTDRDGLVASSDRAMYAAKQLGRNQVIAAGDPAATALSIDTNSSSREQQALLGTVEALAAVVDARDSYTAAHSVEVATLSQRLAVSVGCNAKETHLIGLAARLHDIGKIAIPDAILNKPGRLTKGEWQIITKHPAIGAEIAGRIPALRAITPLIRAHHERYDGTGYPDRLADETIPLGARIIGPADAYNAMITERPYGDKRSPTEALKELRRCAGSQFDPSIIDALVRILTHEHREVEAA